MKQTWENGKKPSFGPNFGLFFGPNLLSPPFFLFFSKNWLFNLLYNKGSYHDAPYQKKLMIQLWENLVTDGRTDRQTDESDFIGRCPTNVERPTP